MLIYDKIEIADAVIAILLVVILFGARKFYNKFADELGKQTAELVTIKQKTKEVEVVKKFFNEKLELFKKDIQLDFVKEVEPLKATLNKENIAYQIYTAEYIKMRFERLDELYAKLYALERHIIMLFPFSKEFNQEELFEKHGNLLSDFYKPAEDAFAKSLIYIDDDVFNSVKNLLDECYKAFDLARQWYTSLHISKEYRTEPHTNQYIELDEKRIKTIEGLNSLLKEVEVNFKKNLTAA